MGKANCHSLLHNLAARRFGPTTSSPSKRGGNLRAAGAQAPVALLWRARYGWQRGGIVSEPDKAIKAQADSDAVDEDEEDIRAAEEARAETRAPIPWKHVKADLGLA
jgi:hypothetical protein